MSCLSVYGKENIKYVNTFIGSAPTKHPSKWDGHGRTFPGAVAPFGFVQLTPETRVGSEKGYDYRDSAIFFFSCWKHYSGYPSGSSGEGQIMPVKSISSFQVNKSSRPFLHEKEKATPGYYNVSFSDDQTIVETTASVHSGIFRFSYKNEINPKIFIGDIGKIVLEGKQTVKGSKRSVFVEFNTPWKDAQPSGDGYIFTFDLPEDQIILLKLSTSSVDFDNARKNLKAEIPGWDFDEVKGKTQKLWNEKLSVIEIQDNSGENKTKFYTALYHSLLIPWVFSDADGRYRGRDNKVYKAKGKNQYGAFSPWDTFRSLHPLLCIIEPEVQSDIIKSILDVYLQTNKLPRAPMTGYHSIPVMVDSYFKGCNDFDIQLAYEAMRKLLMESPWRYDDMPAYISNGYVPATYQESVTRTVEYAYDDWTLSRLAKELNKTSDYAKLQKRALSYRNLFDPEQLFLVPRNSDGFIFSDSEFGYKEGDKWNYSLFVPQNIRDIINLKGGNNAFSEFLDSAIVNNHIIFDNEPNFHIPYLFNYAGKPSKTQQWVSKIREELFTDGVGGLPGNDDLGSMSSWYVFNALGFLPVTPGMPEYNIGTPMFEKVTIHLPNENDFSIAAKNISEKNKYIQSASLNGKELNNYWFLHSELENSGELVFEMGNQPSSWAMSPDEDAFSITKKKSDFSIEALNSTKKSVLSNEAFWVKFQIKNAGADGVSIIRILADGKEVEKKNVFVAEGKSATDSVSCKLYLPGKTKLTIAGNEMSTSVKVKDSGVRGFEYADFSLQSLLTPGEKQKVSFRIKNIGAKNNVAKVNILQNKKTVLNDKINLSPGEDKLLKYSFAAENEGVNFIQIDRLKGVYKVVAEPLESSLVDISFQNKTSDSLSDKSGLENNGILKGFTSNSDNEFNEESFVEIKNTDAFNALDTTLTLMAWIKPSEGNLGQSSILTQGDFNVIQMSGNRDIEFFAGGWGRGTCNATLDKDITNEWHHIAGVCNGMSLMLYLDGELIATTKLNKTAGLKNNANWNVGRNEEFPGQRMYYGKIDNIKIFAAALTGMEIKEIVKEEKVSK